MTNSVMDRIKRKFGLRKKEEFGSLVRHESVSSSAMSSLKDDKKEYKEHKSFLKEEHVKSCDFKPYSVQQIVHSSGQTRFIDIHEDSSHYEDKSVDGKYSKDQFKDSSLGVPVFKKQSSKEKVMQFIKPVFSRRPSKETVGKTNFFGPSNSKKLIDC
eukprot:GILJ01010707.1.p1 GENE.GILJ01010707.1~~GILJ01010707.1.p1  ORF type:complete len:157 (+),score=35.53 GILJ01010707.1:382-852(+)